MPNLPTRVVLFLSSYTPLFLIMAVKYGSGLPDILYQFES